MSDSESWNAFEAAQAKDVQMSENLPSKCTATTKVKGAIFTCRKTHMLGDDEHLVVVNDDETGMHQVQVTWR